MRGAVVAVAMVVACAGSSPPPAAVPANTATADPPRTPVAVVRKLAAFRDATCACADHPTPGCVTPILGDILAWLRVTPGVSLTELGNRRGEPVAAIEHQLAACMQRTRPMTPPTFGNNGN
jgi:hypothetical protein